MNYDELFIDSHKLPEPLSKRETYGLLERIKQGDNEALAKLVEHNIRLVLYQVENRFKTVQYDKKELVSIGNIGLMKAVTTFDVSRNVEFSTYATRCIGNEILMFLRNLKKYASDASLNEAIYHNKDGDEIKIEDTLSDDIDFVEEYIDNETHLMIREIVNELPERDRKIIILYFGFYDNKRHNQYEIANMLSISQSYVARLIKRIVSQIGMRLEKKGLIELRIEQKTTEKIEKEGGNKVGRRLQTIYELFSSYTKEQVDAMLEKLSKEERKLITLRYGEDLNNPVSGKLSKGENNKFYKVLLPKMKRLLANPDKEVRTRKRRAVDQTKLQDEPKGIGISVSGVQSGISPKTDGIVMTKVDYEYLLGLLSTPDLNQMIGNLPLKEAVIISLKLGYIGGRCFSTDSVAQLLGIESQEVVDTTKKFLLLYKNSFNQFMDNMIGIVTEDPKKLARIQSQTLPNNDGE